MKAGSAGGSRSDRINPLNPAAFTAKTQSCNRAHLRVPGWKDCKKPVK